MFVRSTAIVTAALIIASTAGAAEGAPAVNAATSVSDAVAPAAESGEAAADSAPDGGSSEIESVTVSARRVAENVQAVPIPIAVVSGSALENAGQFRLEELNQRLPSTNVQFGNPRQTSIAVRGLGNNPANDALESSVGVFLDNVYLGRPGMANVDLIDLDQVSLLRGPQGTLFGKNTTAGVLNLQTRQPTFQPQYKFESSAGNYGYYQVRGSVSGPLYQDVLAGRISVSRSREDGFVEDITDGRDLNGFNRDGVRGQLLFKPSDTFDLRLIGDYNRENSDCCASALYNPGPNGGSVYLNFIRNIGAVVVLDPEYRKVTLDTPQHMSVNQGGGSAEANWQVGEYKLTSISAYRNWRFVPTNDADGTSINAITNAGQAVKDEQWTQELRFATPTGRAVQTVVGLYYFYQHQDNQTYTYYGPDAGAYTGRAFFNNASSTVSQFLGTNSAAVFAQSTWNVTDRWSLTGGLRETYEDKFTRVHRNPATGTPTFQAAFGPYESGKLTRHDANTSSLASVSYKITDDVLGYVSVSEGAKAGGINPIVPSAGLTTASLYVNPEKARDYELGFKSTLLERRLQVNANLFLTNVTDYQATQLEESSPGVFVQTLTNIGKVRTKGLELELQAVPVPGLHLSLDSSYNDATYISYPNAPCSAEALVGGTTVCDLTGSQVVGAPKWIVSPGVEFDHTVLSGLEGFAGADYAWRSGFFGSADNSELARVRSYGLLNLRAGVNGEWGRNKWSLWAWANNVTDKIYTMGGLSAATATLQYAEFPGQPRTVGATIRLEF
jgi:iron complex outermembrane receptor protein